MCRYRGQSLALDNVQEELVHFSLRHSKELPDAKVPVPIPTRPHMMRDRAHPVSPD